MLITPRCNRQELATGFGFEENPQTFVLAVEQLGMKGLLKFLTSLAWPE